MKKHLLDLPVLGSEYQDYYDYPDAGDMALCIPLFLGSTGDIMLGYAKAAAISALSYIKNTDVVINGVPVFIAIEEEHIDVVADVTCSIPADNIVFFSRSHDYPQIDPCSGAALSMKLLPLLTEKLQQYDVVILSDAENFIVNPRGNAKAETLPICDVLNQQQFALASHSYQSSLQFTRQHLTTQLNAIGSHIERLASQLGTAIDLTARVSQGLTMGFTAFRGSHRHETFKRVCEALIGVVNDETLLEVYAHIFDVDVLPLQNMIPISVMSDLRFGNWKQIYHCTGFELMQNLELMGWYEKQIALIT